MKNIVDRFLAIFSRRMQVPEKVFVLVDYRKKASSLALVMDDEDQKRMNELVSQMRSISGVTSEAEVVAEAIGLLVWYVSTVKAGQKLYIVENGEPVRVRIVFQSAAK